MAKFSNPTHSVEATIIREAVATIRETLDSPRYDAAFARHRQVAIDVRRHCTDAETAIAEGRSGDAWGSIGLAAGGMNILTNADGVYPQRAVRA